MAQKYTEARKEGNRKWDAANLDRISIALPKGKKDDVKAAAVAVGESMNQYIINAVEQRMERDKAPQEYGELVETQRDLTTVQPMKIGILDLAAEAARAAGATTADYISTAIENQIKRDRAESPQEATGAISRPGVVSLPSEAIKTAQEAAEAAGEGLPQFVTRAISETVERQKEAGK